MFNTKKFGGYISRLRKERDMTQSELAEKLNLTRQAISGYERGDNFPDVSILVKMAEIFGVTLDKLIKSGEPTRGESLILGNLAVGNDNVIVDNINDVVGLAPLLKPSVLAKLSSGLAQNGIDISNIVALAEHLNDESVISMLENATFDPVNEELLEKLIPLLDKKSNLTILNKIIDRQIDWHLISALVPYIGGMTSQFEAAVIDGALPWEALGALKEGLSRKYESLFIG